MSDAEVTEHLNVVFRGVASTLGSYLVNRTHESNVFLRKNPVQVAILYLLIVLVLFVVELSEVVPTVTNRYL